jgi:hypothetical protein
MWEMREMQERDIRLHSSLNCMYFFRGLTFFCLLFFKSFVNEQLGNLIARSVEKRGKMKIFSDRWKRAICHELVIRKSFLISTRSIKPSPFNSCEKTILIQPSWKSRSRSTQSKKPFPFNPVEKAVPIQPTWKSRPHSTHLKKPSPFNSVEKAVRSFICVDHPAAMTSQLRTYLFG